MKKLLWLVVLSMILPVSITQASGTLVDSMRIADIQSNVAEIVNPNEILVSNPAPLGPGFIGSKAVLADNGPLVTHPGGGAGGADASALQTTLGMNTLGAGAQQSLGYSVADDFLIAAAGWDIDHITCYAYQTGSSTTSTLTGLYLRIWDGEPGAGGSIIWGDMTTNRMTTTGWTNIYRVTDTTLTTATTRPIMFATADLSATPISLTTGSYWLDFAFTGSLASGPWAPPITILGQTTTGNSKQYTTAWAALTDTGTLTPQGMPFLIEGNVISGGYATLDPGTSNQSGLGGTTLIHTLTLTNNSGQNENYDLSLSFPNAWTTQITSTDPVFLNDGASTTVTVSVIVPPAAVAPDSDSCTLTATGMTSATVTTATLNSYALDPDLFCGANTIFDQPFVGQTDYYTSDAYEAITCADDFSGLTSSIGAVEWWGIEIDFTTFTACVKTTTDFVITFYGSGSIPGAIEYQETVTATRTTTTESDIFLGSPVYKYHADLSASVNLSAGWVSVQATDSGDVCDFLWADGGTPPFGLAMAANDGTGWLVDPYAENADVAFCLIEGAASPFVSLEPSVSDMTDLGGVTVTHSFTLINQSGGSDTFNLALAGQTWTSTITSTNPITLADGASAPVTVTVAIPSGAVPPNSDTCTLTATGTTLSDSSTLNTYAADPDLVCGDDTVFGQAFVLDFASTSDDDPGLAVADDFSGLSSAIDSLNWWGIDFYYDGSAWSACTKTDLVFDVIFYQDGSGMPGTIQHQEVVTATRIATTELFAGAPVYKYSADLATPVSMASGWVSIVGHADTSGACWFLWNSSTTPPTNGSGYMEYDGSTWAAGYYNADLAFCLNSSAVATPTSGPSPTAGPIPATGPAGVGLLLLAIGALMSLAGIRRR